MIAQVRELAWKGQALPKATQSVPSEARNWNPEQLSEAEAGAGDVLRQQQQARAGNQGLLSTTSRSAQVSRSKRKIAFTLSGPVVGIGLGIAGLAVGAAIAAGPFGVGAVVALAITAVVAAAAAYAFKKGWRNARAAFYANRYVQRDYRGGFVFNNTKAALNGVRYVIQKRELSRIADDIKELHTAIKSFEDQERKGVNCCQDAAELVYKYHRVHLLITPIEEHLELFRSFYDYMVKELNGALHGTGEHAKQNPLSDANIYGALRMAHAHVCDAKHDSNRCLTLELKGIDESEHASAGLDVLSPNDIPKICYKHDSSGKPRKPMVSTLRSLNEEQRRPFVRLVNDAYYITHHGEHSAMAAYSDEREAVKKLFPGIKFDEFFGPCGDEVPLLRLPPLRPAPSESWGSVEGRTLAETGVAPETQEGADSGSWVLRGLGAEAGKQVGIRPGAIGFAVAREAALSGSSQLGAVAASSAASGGISAAGSIVMSIAQAAVEAKNLKNELQAVAEEVGKRFEEMNVERLMTGLRTILKDGKFFEKCVDEVGKMLLYQKEFSWAVEKSKSGITCGLAYEMVYRILKAYKHFVLLAAYIPFLKQFRDLAVAILDKAKELDEAEESRVNSVVKRWVGREDHSNCKGKGLCYGGMDL